MNQKMKQKLKKIEELWIRAYDKIFSDVTLQHMADLELLEDVKQEMLMLQIQDVRENFDSYRYMSLKKLEEIILSVAVNEGVRAAKEVVKEYCEYGHQNQA